jgi:hypothetical protein
MSIDKYSISYYGVETKYKNKTIIEKVKTNETLSEMIEASLDNVVFGWDLRYSPIPRFEIIHQFFLMTLAMQFWMLFISVITFRSIDKLTENVPKMKQYISESHWFDLLYLITLLDWAASLLSIGLGFYAEFTYKMSCYKAYCKFMLICWLSVVPLIAFDITYTVVFLLKLGALLICKYMISLMHYGIIYDYVSNLPDLELRRSIIEEFKDPFSTPEPIDLNVLQL